VPHLRCCCRVSNEASVTEQVRASQSNLQLGYCTIQCIMYGSRTHCHCLHYIVMTALGAYRHYRSYSLYPPRRMRWCGHTGRQDHQGPHDGRECERVDKTPPTVVDGIQVEKVKRLSQSKSSNAWIYGSTTLSTLATLGAHSPETSG
jgi:hypothetical protein